MKNTTLEQPDAADVPSRRRAGRPRDQALTELILEKALEAYVDLGWSGFNLDVVAKRAGAGKAALYARWSDREQLLFDVVDRIYPPFEPNGADLHADLIALGHHVLTVHEDHLRGAIFWSRLRADLATHSEALRRLDEEILRHRVRLFRLVVQRAVERGELEDADAAMIMLDMFAGGLVNFLLYSAGSSVNTLKQGKQAWIERFAVGALAAGKVLSAAGR